jgi:2'-5' RNA ligase
MPEKQRLFFALWPDAPIQAAIAKAGRAVAEAHQLRGRFMPSARIHLTLLFLGDVETPRVEALTAAAAGVQAPAFDLTLRRAGSFHRSRVLWLGPDPAPPELTALWLQLRTRAQAAGVPYDTLALSPHVTCMRDADRAIKPTPIEPIAWPVREFALVRSVLGTQPQYHVVSQWPLQAGLTQSVKTVQDTGGPE